MANPFAEANKDTGRLAVFGAISTIATYFFDLWFPGLPVEVKGSFLVIILAGLTYLDSWIHNNDKIKANGITTF